MKGIRLTDHQVFVIKEGFKTCFQEGDHIWLFGSRADLSKKGGDIDLYIETTMQPLEKAIDAKHKLFIQIISKLGDQRIDIVINNNSGAHLIYKIAREEGVQLV